MHAPDFFSAPWYAVQVRSRHEKAVAASLSGKGLDTFLPLYRARRAWSDRVQEVDLPLFPGYLFSAFDPSRDTFVVRTAGIVKVVSLGSRYEPIDPNELTGIRRALDSGLIVLPWPGLAAGGRVLIEHGPLKGLEGNVVRAKGTYRLIVTVGLLQRSISVEIERHWVRPVLVRRPPGAASAEGGHSIHGLR